MSTKIYNAYIYHGSIEDLFQEIRVIRQKYREEMMESILSYSFTCSALPPRLFEEFCHYNFNGQTEKAKDIQVSALSPCQLSHFLHYFVESGLNHPLNIAASCVVYPYNGKLYVQFFGVQPTLNEKFVDFHYQNQTDQPEGISDEEWSQREIVWDGIFEEEDIPSVAGLVYEFHSDLHGFCYKLRPQKKE